MCVSMVMDEHFTQCYGCLAGYPPRLCSGTEADLLLSIRKNLMANAHLPLG